MKNNFDDFRAQVAGSPVLRERFERIADHIIDAVADKHGVQITRSDAVNLPVVRVSTYSGSEDFLNWQDEAVLIPAVQKAQEAKRVHNALSSHENTPEAQAVRDRVGSMTPIERMRYFRANGLDKVQPKKQDLSSEKRGELERQLEMTSDPASRIAIGRKLGLA